MSSFAALCGIDTAARRASIDHTARLIEATGVELVRFAWCDLHGNLRGKTLVASAAARAMQAGVGMVSTLMLKDTSDRTAYKVFEAGGVADLPGFECASNLLLMADPASYRQLPWAPKTGWVQCQPWFQDGAPVALDTRRILQAALARLAAQALGMRCGLEVEFHIYRIHGYYNNNSRLSSKDAGYSHNGDVDLDSPGTLLPDSKLHPHLNPQLNPQLNPHRAAWPGLPPHVSMIHPGYNLLSEAWADMSDEPLRIVQHTAQALGLPLLSLEIELGPSQVEAVFEATDALTAADNMVLFRSAVTQALRRAGYHATFMCRPPFPNIMSSGWHLHQSLVQLDSSHQPLVAKADGRNAFMRDAPAPGTTPLDAQHTLSRLGEHYLAGLLAHARGMAALATPTINGFERYAPNALAPQSILWGRDNRGAMLRVVGQAGDAATRIENRIGEPAANPYLYVASQIHAGLDGIARQLKAPPASTAPYDAGNDKLATSLGEALDSLQADNALVQGFGQDFVGYFTRIKQQELRRFGEAQDKLDWQRREYFSRF
jgi:glutamine synthetase